MMTQLTWGPSQPGPEPVGGQEGSQAEKLLGQASGQRLLLRLAPQGGPVIQERVPKWHLCGEGPQDGEFWRLGVPGRVLGRGSGCGLC